MLGRSLLAKVVLQATKFTLNVQRRIRSYRDDIGLTQLVPGSFMALGFTFSKSETPECQPIVQIPAAAPSCCKNDVPTINDGISNPNVSFPCSCSNPRTNLKQSEVKEPEELTHHFLLKQASSVIVDSVTRLLTETVSALDTYHFQYSEMLNLCIALLEQSRAANETSQELINCRLIVLRNQMEDVKRNLQETEVFLLSVQDLVNQAAHTAYLARAEYSSIALSERLQSALLEVNRIKAATKELENDMVQLQAVLIVESGNSLK